MKKGDLRMKETTRVIRISAEKDNGSDAERPGYYWIKLDSGGIAVNIGERR